MREKMPVTERVTTATATATAANAIGTKTAPEQQEKITATATASTVNRTSTIDKSKYVPALLQAARTYEAIFWKT